MTIVEATGGEISQIIDDGVGYIVHVFTSSGEFEIISGSGEVEYLIVAGGGGAPANINAGGGGGGGVLSGTVSLNVGIYPVVVGLGGAPTSARGDDSTLHDITATGGGRGGTWGEATGQNGGCGGGGTAASSGSPRQGGAGIAGPPLQGYNGGAGSVSSNLDNRAGGGGGGADGIGGSASLGLSGFGGPGRLSSITGTPTYYAGGGAGASRSDDIANWGSNGIGGGGRASDGDPNTGGGGSTGPGNTGYSGGSGIVIVRYQTTKWWFFSGYVYEQGSPAAGRIVRAYQRATGELLASTTSSGNGYYYLETTYSGAHYLVALDDDVGNSYNLARLDNIMPIEVV